MLSDLWCEVLLLYPLFFNVPHRMRFLVWRTRGPQFPACYSPKPVPKLLVELIAVSCLKEGIDYFLVGHVIVSWWQNVCKTSV